MRFVLLLATLVFVLAGCAESQTSVSLGQEPAHEDCWFLCGGGEETHVHFDFFPLVLALGLIVVALIVTVAVAGGQDRAQQQQQVVIQVSERRR